MGSECRAGSETGKINLRAVTAMSLQDGALMSDNSFLSRV